MSLALLFHYLLLNMFRMLIHPSSGACDLFDELFHGLYYSASMCVGVTLWFGWGGVVSGYHTIPGFSLHPDTTPLQASACIPIPHHSRLQSASRYHTTPGFSLHTDTTPPQPNHNVTPTHIEAE